MEWTSAFPWFYVVNQAADSSVSSVPGKDAPRRALANIFPHQPHSPLSANPQERHLPPTSENCLRKSWLRWHWPLYLGRAQTWLLWQWGYSRTHQNVGPPRTSSASGRALRERQHRKPVMQHCVSSGKETQARGPAYLLAVEGSLYPEEENQTLEKDR